MGKKGILFRTCHSLRRHWIKASLAAVLTCAVFSFGCKSVTAEVPSTDAAGEKGELNKDQRMAWWRQARFGMFIHWGPVSLKGTEISWSRANSNPTCPNRGPIPVEVYDNLYKEFNPVEFDAGEWVAIAQASGMRYMVLTAKHCDGFCLWHSKVTDYNISKTPFVRDVCAELAKAAHTAGIRVGWYYSPMDWRDPDCRTERNAKYVASMQGQLREILSNYGRIDLLWFDTDGRSAPWDQKNTYGLVRQLQPHIIINNRLDMGSSADYKAGQIGPNADYYTPEQRIGEFDNQRPWETCMTLGTQWSWKPNDNIKSLKECLHILIKCVGGDGNLLLNVGPMPDGRIEPRQVERLKEMGAWLKEYGRSIYATRGGPFKPGPWGASTHKGGRIYVHILDRSGKSLLLPPIDKKIVSSSLLTGGNVDVKQTPDGITVTVPKQYLQEIDTIVVLELDGPAGEITPVSVAPVESKKQRDKRMQWWREARFGMFIHWGLYAVPAGEWKGKRIGGIGEWIMERADVPVAEYEKLAGQFNPVKFDADEWVSIAKGAGMKYIVITSKHHDGFCLWDSKVSNYDIMDASPFKRDILKELAAACKKQGIKFCFYHSIMDWHHPDAQAPFYPNYNDRNRSNPNFSRYVKTYMKPQLKELITGYGPLGVLWFDGEWIKDWTEPQGKDLYNYVRGLQPNIIINNRVGKGRKGMQGMSDKEYAGDFGTPEQQIPAKGLPGVDWESCMTMNDTWGYKHYDDNWKSTEDLLRKLADIASKGGNFLLNVGPTGEGLIPGPSVERLAAMGKWMEVNSESIYGTTASPIGKAPWGRCTAKGNKLYLHVFDWPSDGKLVVPGLKDKVRRAYLLDKKSKLIVTHENEQTVVLAPDGISLDPIDTVVVLEIEAK